MKPKITVLTDFQWLMLDDDNQNELPFPVDHSEHLSLHCPSRNQSETYPHQPQHLAA